MPGPRPANFDYQTYLASREWGLLKEQVRERSKGKCEHCIAGPYEETHHVTYARIGREDIADLMAVCRPCHTFLSGKGDINPLDDVWLFSARFTEEDVASHLAFCVYAGEVEDRVIHVIFCKPHPIMAECLPCKYGGLSVPNFLRKVQA